ncbi:B-cell receptor-associated protein 31-like isoform X1 [Limulus polyphemus]|uniref:Endoplasmic reticulum transmembrane protein n=1 Tax=Limulus polyphemus TaxID=6850 RepID=A0ABM1BMZ5_LIMPO|nr:B-cell receptor-associated protein 31-like isoform X1 [Limulus polyphemus]XP_013785247.1 B-cell receptor-associated protein 31-like isoform X1 [Limulus polyphemus]XP_022254269.1 B-cell receptor-associated protein 31-like isoform X1 [Limulus polyphemus]XP_022254271.1 B-cell receptor-associated protein 31-like isoform X1 [Limulus polyphemus]
MSIQWTLIASFLYGEIAVVGLLLLPFISSLRWARILKSRLFRLIRERINIYFGILFFFHLICFFDAVREMRKYSSTEVSDHDTLSTELQRNMRLFRAQRNFHIMLFTFFLLFVIRRLVSLILNQATLAAQCEASVLQARRATETAERLMQEKERQTKSLDDECASNLNNETLSLKEELEQVKNELEHLKKDRNSMKAQAESVNKEYDRLVKEYAKLQEELDMITGSSSVKKDE